jgi:hypothetical protein
MARRLTADKRETRDFPKFAYSELLLSANRYTPAVPKGNDKKQANFNWKVE